MPVNFGDIMRSDYYRVRKYACDPLTITSGLYLHHEYNRALKLRPCDCRNLFQKLRRVFEDAGYILPLIGLSKEYFAAVFDLMKHRLGNRVHIVYKSLVLRALASCPATEKLVY